MKKTNANLLWNLKFNIKKYNAITYFYFLVWTVRNLPWRRCWSTRTCFSVWRRCSTSRSSASFIDCALPRSAVNICSSSATRASRRFFARRNSWILFSFSSIFCSHSRFSRSFLGKKDNVHLERKQCTNYTLFLNLEASACVRISICHSFVQK